MKHWHKLRLQNGTVYLGIDELDSIAITELETFSYFLNSLDLNSCNEFLIQEQELGVIDGVVYAWNDLNHGILNAMASELISKINTDQ